MKEFLNQNFFRSLKELENTEGLNVTGLYAIRVKNIPEFPETLRTELEARNTTIIYIGKGQNIGERLNQECRGKGHGTFFRSVGALLGYKPPKGSLVKRQNNYRFHKVDRNEIVSWINENLEFSFVKLFENIKNVEKDLIKNYKPILNIQNNPQPLKELKTMRQKCKNVALGKCECKQTNN